MKKRNNDLPPYCRKLPSGKIQYRPRGGTAQTFSLHKDATINQIWDYYNDLVIESQPFSWKQLCEHYYKSPRFLKLAPRTVIDYKNYAKSIEAVFGAADMSKVRTVDLVKWRDRRAFGENGAPEQTNKELKFLRMVIRHAVQYELLGSNYRNQSEEVELVVRPDSNIIIKTKKLMTQEMFYKIRENCSEELKVASTLSYITGMRLGDIISLKKDDVDTHGNILKEQNKTHAFVQKSVTTALVNTVQAALSLRGHKKNMFCQWLIPNKQGKKYTEDGFRANWQRARLKAYPETKGAPEGYRTRFHDLRHRGTTDFTGSDKASFTGHTGEGRQKMAAVYDDNTNLPIASPTLDIDLPPLIIKG